MEKTPYNKTLAVAYAHKYAFIRNPSYYDFTNLGGNCTNFVSQCLVAGTMPQNYAYPFGWFYKSLSSRSPSFTGVQFLYEFLTRKNLTSGPFATEIDVSKVELGDIIQLSFDGNIFAHSLIVTDFCPINNEPLVTTNTYDSKDKPLYFYRFSNLRALHIEGGYN